MYCIHKAQFAHCGATLIKFTRLHKFRIEWFHEVANNENFMNVEAFNFFVILTCKVQKYAKVKSL